MNSIFTKYPATAIAGIVVLGTMIVVLLLLPTANSNQQDRVYLIVLGSLVPAFTSLLAVLRGEQAADKATTAATKSSEIAQNTDGRLSAIEAHVGLQNGQVNSEGEPVPPNPDAMPTT